MKHKFKIGDTLINDSGYHVNGVIIIFKVKVIQETPLIVRSLSYIEHGRYYAYKQDGSTEFVVNKGKVKHWNLYKPGLKTEPNVIIKETIVMKETKKSVYIYQFEETWIDTLYHNYCKFKNRDKFFTEDTYEIDDKKTD